MNKFEKLKKEIIDFISIIDQREIDDNEDLLFHLKDLESLLAKSEGRPKYLDYLSSEMLLTN